uniref:Uncharacterized protein n=1 Tax=Noccaea caerulescens TaxID=107243 RepID=A0A1J3CX54_NOCCA
MVRRKKKTKVFLYKQKLQNSKSMHQTNHFQNFTVNLFPCSDLQKNPSPLYHMNFIKTHIKYLEEGHTAIAYSVKSNHKDIQSYSNNITTSIQKWNHIYRA